MWVGGWGSQNPVGGQFSSPESTAARRAHRAKFSHAFGVATRVVVQDSHSSAWPLEWSVTHKRGIL